MSPYLAICACGHPLIAHEPMGGYVGACLESSCKCKRGESEAVRASRLQAQEAEKAAEGHRDQLAAARFARGLNVGGES